jgi:hypothetical protein
MLLHIEGDRKHKGINTENYIHTHRQRQTEAHSETYTQLYRETHIWRHECVYISPHRDTHTHAVITHVYKHAGTEATILTCIHTRNSDMYRERDIYIYIEAYGYRQTHRETETKT